MLNMSVFGTEFISVDVADLEKEFSIEFRLGDDQIVNIKVGRDESQLDIIIVDGRNIRRDAFSMSFPLTNEEEEEAA